MSKKSETSSGGVGFLGLLAIVFITLKLTNVISWSWWWVLCPLWGGVAFILLVITIFWMIAAILAFFED